VVKTGIYMTIKFKLMDGKPLVFRRSWRNSHFAKKIGNIKINLFLGAIHKLNY
jgi:hypothetical protein